ncbi:MAG TPA: RDD family protein [Nostocaceae cyanobacterium]|nr:RDD family protein [Nostocaceae cyanobacterium]
MEEKQYAGFWVRFAASFIDGIILSIVSSILGFILASIKLQTLAFILQIVISWLYYAYLESSENQATVGKGLVNIVVTDVEGNRITFAKATIRYFSKYLSAIILLIGYIMAAFTEKKQALHDLIAGTLVVKK